MKQLEYSMIYQNTILRTMSADNNFFLKIWSRIKSRTTKVFRTTTTVIKLFKSTLTVVLDGISLNYTTNHKYKSMLESNIIWKCIFMILCG